jgi:hypothetical protein
MTSQQDGPGRSRAWGVPTGDGASNWFADLLQGPQEICQPRMVELNAFIWALSKGESLDLEHRGREGAGALRSVSGSAR